MEGKLFVGTLTTFYLPLSNNLTTLLADDQNTSHFITEALNEKCSCSHHPRGPQQHPADLPVLQQGQVPQHPGPNTGLVTLTSSKYSSNYI